MNIVEIKDFKESSFKNAFRTYFKEIGIELKEDTDVFDLITKSKEEEGMRCCCVEADGEVIAFIMFQIENMKSRFFTEDLGFIREFWVKEERRRKKIGSKLMEYCINEFKKFGIKKLILTYEEEALLFYEKQGFALDLSYMAKNKMQCVVKNI